MSRSLLVSLGVVAGCGSVSPDEIPAATPPSAVTESELTAGTLTLVESKARAFYVTDLEYNPVAALVRSSTRWVSPSLPSVPLLVHVELDVPGHGRLWYSASNGGSGYLASGQTLDLVFEIARDRLAVGDSLYTEWTARGDADARLQAQLDRARTSLDKAALYAPGSAAREAAAESSLAASAPASEQLLLMNAQARLVARGGLTKSQRISTFGLYAQREGARWAHSVNTLFSDAVANWHWQMVVQPDGSFNWGFYDKDSGLTLPSDGMVTFLSRDQGKSIRGHCMAWLLGQPTWPSWLTWNYPNVRDQVYRFTNEVVRRYPQIHTWNIANEVMNPPYVAFSEPDMVDLVRGVANRVRSIQPSATLGINEVELWGLGAAQHFSAASQVFGTARFVRDLKQAGVPFHYVGMQLYHFMDRDLVEVDRLLERYAKLGKRIRIAETMAPSVHDGRPNYWHRPWDAALQAEWLESMFVVGMSKDFVDEWNWWDIADYKGAYNPNGGLLDANYIAKPAYYRLMDMVSWYRDRLYPITSYNLARDWSDSRNPNGVWTYRADYGGPQILPHQNLTVGGAGHGWAPSTTAIPSLFRRRGAYADIPDGTVGGHGPFRIDWTAPRAGTVDISPDSGLWIASDTPRVMTWALTINDKLVVAGDVARSQANSKVPKSFSKGAGLSIPVVQDAVVRLRVWQNNPADYNTFVGVKWDMRYR